MFRTRMISVFLCFTLLVACLPIFSVSSTADNSGFCQIRIFYQQMQSNGSWGIEGSYIITDNSALGFATFGMSTPIRITRFLIRNDSNATVYFQFDFNAGGVIPEHGSWPNCTNSNLAFTTNGGVTAYSFATSDRTPFSYPASVSNDNVVDKIINSANNRTYFGKVTNSGYVTFTNPVVLTFYPYNSPEQNIYLFFRHLVIGLDDSSYLANLEHYLADISDNTYAISQDVDEINDWMEEEKVLFDDSWDSGGGQTYQEYTSDNNTFWGTLRGLFGFSIFGGLWTLDIFSTSNSLFSSWFSQDNADNINGPSRRSASEETEYIDYYQKNINGELDVFGLGGDSQ